MYAPRVTVREANAAQVELVRAMSRSAKEASAAMARTATAARDVDWSMRLARARRYARLEGLDVAESWEVERHGFLRGLLDGAK